MTGKDKKSAYTPAEVSKMCRMNKETVLRHLRKGVLKGQKIGRQYRISESALKEYLGDELFEELGEVNRPS